MGTLTKARTKVIEPGQVMELVSQVEESLAKGEAVEEDDAFGRVHGIDGSRQLQRGSLFLFMRHLFSGQTMG